MSRREEARTDDSTISMTESLRSLMASGLRYAGDMTGLTVLDETFFRQYGPEQILNRMLSTKSYISTISSLANRNQEASENPALQLFTQVGKGQCGTVWALNGTTMVLKAVNKGKGEQLYNDFCKHQRVDAAFRQTLGQFRLDVSLPRLDKWIGPENTEFWEKHISLFPKDFEPAHAIISSRIFPVPLPVRSAIIDAFAPRDVKRNKESFLSQQENKDCLIRIYLGRRQERLPTNSFRLRNFDLTVNEMEWLRLDTQLFAQAMAQTLAIVHWKAGLDANDMEFVLGSSPTSRLLPTAAELEELDWREAATRLNRGLDFRHRSIEMWLLDFDQCKAFPQDQSGVKQLERGFFFNDPYYPHPSSDNEKDQKLWEIFKDSYLGTSAALTNSNMPKEFIDAIETEGRKRNAGGSLFR